MCTISAASSYGDELVVVENGVGPSVGLISKRANKLTNQRSGVTISRRRQKPYIGILLSAASAVSATRLV
jgi:hypothetical protein